MTTKHFTGKAVLRIMQRLHDKPPASLKGKYRQESVERILMQFSDVLENTKFDPKIIEKIEYVLQHNYTSNKEYVELLANALKKKYEDKKEIQNISLKPVI